MACDCYSIYTHRTVHTVLVLKWLTRGDVGSAGPLVVAAHDLEAGLFQHLHTSILLWFYRLLLKVKTVNRRKNKNNELFKEGIINV